MSISSRTELVEMLDRLDYLAGDGLATALYLSLTLGEPLLLEGEPGVGKTQAAKSLAAALGAPFFRLQCYEGLTAADAMYEWNYAQQLLAIRLGEAAGETVVKADLFRREFLSERPVLQALLHPGPSPAVLLIDEIDRSDDEFEALLFEFLGERTVTIPELGTVRPTVEPVVILTSNRTRELHDALKRRCLYHWIEAPGVEHIVSIVRRRVPHANEPLVRAASAFAHHTRSLGLDKAPGVAETISWVNALEALGVSQLNESAVVDSLAALIKSPDDVEAVRESMANGDLAQLVAR